MKKTVLISFAMMLLASCAGPWTDDDSSVPKKIPTPKKVEQPQVQPKPVVADTTKSKFPFSQKVWKIEAINNNASKWKLAVEGRDKPLVVKLDGDMPHFHVYIGDYRGIDGLEAGIMFYDDTTCRLFINSRNIDPYATASQCAITALIVETK